MPIRDVGYLHARSGAAQALLLVGEHETSRRALAESELADARACSADGGRWVSRCASQALRKARPRKASGAGGSR